MTRKRPLSSLLRVSRQNASIVPNNIAKGMTSCAVCGNFSAVISSRNPERSRRAS